RVPDQSSRRAAAVEACRKTASLGARAGLRKLDGNTGRLPWLHLADRINLGATWSSLRCDDDCPDHPPEPLRAHLVSEGLYSEPARDVLPPKSRPDTTHASGWPRDR